MDLKQYIAENACPIKFESPCGYSPRALKRKNFDFEVFLPDYGKNLQRELVWTLSQKQEIIKSIIVERNIPPIYMVIKNFCENNEVFQIIDGKQRLSTILSFLKDGFTIPFGSQNLHFSELPNDFRNKIENTTILFHIAYDDAISPINDRKKVETYKFFANAGTPQDIEHINSF